MNDKHFLGAFLDLTERLCVVIGGGPVAERKVHSLLMCNAKVKVIAPGITSGLSSLEQEGKIEYLARSFQTGDTEGAIFTIAATDSPKINQMVAEEAKQQGRLVNTVHSSSGGNVILPSVVRRGSLQVAVSTSGLSPALAKAIREELEDYFGEEYETYLKKLNEVRTLLMKTIQNENVRMEIIREIIQSDVKRLLQNGNEPEADRTIRVIIERRINHE